MNTFTFLTRKKHESSRNKLIVTKFTRCTLLMFSNKAFLDLIQSNLELLMFSNKAFLDLIYKLSRKMCNKNKKHKKQRVTNQEKYL